MNNTETLKAPGDEVPRPLGILWRITAVVVGLVVIGILSIGTDRLLVATGVYRDPMTNSMFLIATTHRLVYGVLGCYVTARIAPQRPMRYAIILGVVGLILNILGLMTAIAAGPELGPKWYPIALILAAIPCAWVGGRLRQIQLSKEK